METKKEKIQELLIRIKKINRLYKRATNLQKEHIFDNSLFLVDELVDLGYHRDFVESLVLFGKEFLELTSIKDQYPEYYKKLFPEAFEVFG